VTRPGSGPGWQGQQSQAEQARPGQGQAEGQARPGPVARPGPARKQGGRSGQDDGHRGQGVGTGQTDSQGRSTYTGTYLRYWSLHNKTKKCPDATTQINQQTQHTQQPTSVTGSRHQGHNSSIGQVEHSTNPNRSPRDSPYRPGQRQNTRPGSGPAEG
jgi:hypothetical protein